MRQLDEPILEDNYPVFFGYYYLANDKVITSGIQGTVAALKRDTKASVIRRCDAVGRGLQLV